MAVRLRRVNVPVRGPDGLLGDMTVTMSEQCSTCRNLQEGFRCRAFPGGIPNEIVFKGRDHSIPYPGDNGIRYEPIIGGDSTAGTRLIIRAAKALEEQEP